MATRTKRQVARPVIRAIQVSFFTLLFAIVYGIATNGVVQPIYTQVRAWLLVLLFALTAIATVPSVDDYYRLYNATVAANGRDVVAGRWASGTIERR